MGTKIPKTRLRVGHYFFDLRCIGSDTSEPVVLIHGIGVSGTYHIPLAQELAKTHKVYILDLPGYGKTPRPKQALTIPELAEVVHQFILLMGLKRPALVGQSMGCQIVAELVKSNEASYSKIILFSPTVNKTERTLFYQALRLFQDTWHESLRMNSIILVDYTRMGFTRYFQTAASMIDNHIEDNISLFHLPTLIIRGENDRIVPSEWVRYLSEICHDGRDVMIPGAPHNAHFTNAQEAARLCRDFLKN